MSPGFWVVVDWLVAGLVVLAVAVCCRSLVSLGVMLLRVLFVSLGVHVGVVSVRCVVSRVSVHVWSQVPAK